MHQECTQQLLVVLRLYIYAPSFFNFSTKFIDIQIAQKLFALFEVSMAFRVVDDSIRRKFT